MKRDPQTTQLLRRMRGQLFRGSKLLDRPDTPWRRQRLLDSLSCHGDRIVSEAKDILQLTIRIPYADGDPASGLAFPGATSRIRCNPKTLARASGQKALARIPAGRIAVLDTETTALLDDPATVPFLIGLGRFEPRVFVIEQFFMEDFESEPAMMKLIARRMRAFRALLTYNGASFDLPLLRHRFALLRLSPAAWNKTHWDVLRTARRFWGAAPRSRSLLHLEQDVFGFRRVRDIAANRIPEVYRDYLGGRRAERLAAVFDHNAQDILTTAAIAVLLAQAE